MSGATSRALRLAACAAFAALAAGCSGPTREIDALRSDVAALRAEVAALRAQLGGSETAAPHESHATRPSHSTRAPHGFASMSIDTLEWSDQARNATVAELMHGQPAMLVAHVVEWDGYERMKQFTAEADPVFYLEAHGREPVRAHMGIGGITGSDGALRYVMLTVTELEQRIEPGVAYSLRARNGERDRKWIVADGLTIARR